MISKTTYQIQKEQLTSVFDKGTLIKPCKHSFLIDHIQKNQTQLLLIVLLGWISSCTGILLTLTIGDFFMLIFHTNGSKGKLLAMLGIRLESGNLFFIVFLSLAVVKFLCSFIDKYLTVKQSEQFVRNIRSNLFQAQINTHVEVFKSKAYGNYLLRYSNDMKVIQSYLSKGILGGIQELFVVLMGIGVLLKIRWQLGFVILCLLFFTGVASWYVSFLQKKYISVSRDKRSGLLAFVTKTFSRFQTMKDRNQESEMMNRFEKKSTDLYNANLTNGKRESFLQSLIPFLQYIIIFSVLFLIAGGYIQSNASDAVVIILLLMLLQGAVRRLLKVPGILNKGRISLDKINDLTT
jgi:ABC-type multidrug transport system fused ATPase/permease subunit